ncbi:hypothetical protein EDB89DRAFT_218506 [Lactarius sanguifluus]|nr:hypothetical protein EDB89DRAFT_218506 [Lactarius sanguifluus]
MRTDNTKLSPLGRIGLLSRNPRRIFVKSIYMDAHFRLPRWPAVGSGIIVTQVCSMSTLLPSPITLTYLPGFPVREIGRCERALGRFDTDRHCQCDDHDKVTTGATTTVATRCERRRRRNTTYRRHRPRWQQRQGRRQWQGRLQRQRASVVAAAICAVALAAAISALQEPASVCARNPVPPATERVLASVHQPWPRPDAQPAMPDTLTAFFWEMKTGVPSARSQAIEFVDALLRMSMSAPAAQ